MDSSSVSAPDSEDLGSSSLRPQLDLRPTRLAEDAAASDDDRVVVEILNAALEGDLRRAKKLAKELRKSGKSVAQAIADLVGVPRNHRPGPLHLAAARGEVEMCRFLLRTCKVDVNSTDADGATPLMFAVQGVGSIDVTNLLLSHKADPNKADSNGIGPLHIAAEQGFANCVKTLLEAGADANSHIEDGDLPVEIAALNGSDECVNILFPVTSPKVDYEDWSTDGITLHAKAVSSEVNDMFLGLAEKVLPCVVIIQDSRTGAYYTGSVLFKSKVDTYIVTQSRNDQSDGDLVVIFHDKSRYPAYILMKDDKFAVLNLGLVCGDCKAITFKDPTVVCNSFTLIPKDPKDINSLSVFEKTPGFMHQPEWYSARGDAPVNTIPETKNYFINLCHHGSTSMMVACPVFNMGGDCMGLVVGDCKDKDGDIDIPHKICLKGSCVRKAIREMFEAGSKEIDTLTPKQDHKRKQCNAESRQVRGGSRRK